VNAIYRISFTVTHWPILTPFYWTLNTVYR